MMWFFLAMAIGFLVIAFIPAEEPFEPTVMGRVLMLFGIGILFAWWLHYSA